MKPPNPFLALFFLPTNSLAQQLHHHMVPPQSINHTGGVGLQSGGGRRCPDLSPFIPEHVVAGRRGPQAGEAEDEEDDGAGGEREAEAAKGRKKPETVAAAAAPKDERKAADAAAFEVWQGRTSPHPRTSHGCPPPNCQLR